jgi:dTDP-4-dehydrorhamnose reductase
VKVVLFGGGGMLGHDVLASSPPGAQTVALSRNDVDITNARSVAEALERGSPDVVINAAAFTHVDRAEVERDQAFAVNADAVRTVADWCAPRGVCVVHVSTDYVFDGRKHAPYTEHDRTAPINVYGASKLAGELALIRSGAPFLLIRTSWLFGVHGRSFPRTMWERARARRPTRVVSDQRGRPTAAADLAKAIWRAIELDLHGVYHAANEGETTWYEMAVRIFDRAGAGDAVSACTAAEYPTPAQRPAYSVLDTRRLQHAGVNLPHWTGALDRFLMQIEPGPPV